ncbi:MAG TPA: M1 family metallopeptidase, partial [Anaerolineales bacterium]|nr:M1 family metallopeptidase [Anaerolineales bacterium]
NIPPPADPALDSVHLQTTLPELAGRVPDVLNRYQLDVSITPEQLSFQGNLVLDYTNLESTALGTLFFRLLPNGQRSYGNGSLSVDNVQVNGENQAVNLSLEDTILEVTLDPALEPGASATIAMNFQGEVPEDFGGEDSGGYGIFNFSAEVMALASWYPILAVYDEAGWHLDPVSYIGDSVYSDMADYEVEIELPADQVLVSTGVARQTGAGGDRQLLVVESGPVRDFFMILSPRFRSLQSRFGGTRVNSYYLPGHENGGQRALEVAVLSIETFNRQFGAYPYTELDVVDAPMQNAGGVEYPGIVLVGDSQYTDYNETGFAVTTAHEVAHQWWYNLVGNDVFAEPWLDEALASYTSGIYLEAAQGKPALDGLMSHYQERYQRSLDSSGDHPINESLAYFESQTNPNAYGGIVYAKGALFFDAVRQEIGDEAFFAAMRSYFDTYRYGIAAGKDLLAAFEAAAGRPLAELFQTWNVASQP